MISMYALVGFLDDKTEKYIEGLWDELSQNNISHYAKETLNLRPHITIADYDNLDKEEFIVSLNEFYEAKSKVNVTFSALGTFLKTGILFLSPTITTTLVDFHHSHHEHFQQYTNEDSLYIPNRWIPHCTIANRLTQEKLIEAFNYCSNKIDIIDAKISEIALLEVKAEKNNTISAPVVYSKKLL